MHLIYGSGGGPEDIGHKAYALTRLSAAGLTPPFLVIPHRELGGWRGGGSAAGKRKILSWAAGSLPRLGPASSRFIVRSSFLGEDSSSRSFAGMFSSHVAAGPAELARAIDGVLAGARTGRLGAYAGARPGPAGMSVIIQRFIEPLLSGVAYVDFPAGTFYLEYSDEGYDSVVSGRCSPRTYFRDGVFSASGEEETQDLLEDIVAVLARTGPVSGLRRAEVEFQVDRRQACHAVQYRPATRRLDPASIPLPAPPPFFPGDVSAAEINSALRAMGPLPAFRRPRGGILYNVSNFSRLSSAVSAAVDEDDSAREMLDRLRSWILGESRRRALELIALNGAAARKGPRRALPDLKRALTGFHLGFCLASHVNTRLNVYYKEKLARVLGEGRGAAGGWLGEKLLWENWLASHARDPRLPRARRDNLARLLALPGALAMLHRLSEKYQSLLLSCLKRLGERDAFGEGRAQELAKKFIALPAAALENLLDGPGGLSASLLPGAGDAVTGLAAYDPGRKVSGRAAVIREPSDLRKITRGCVAVTSHLDTDLYSKIRLCRALVCEKGGLIAHVAVVCREIRKPCLVKAEGCTSVFRDGDLLEIEGGRVRRLPGPERLGLKDAPRGRAPGTKGKKDLKNGEKA